MTGKKKSAATKTHTTTGPDKPRPLKLGDRVKRNWTGCAKGTGTVIRITGACLTVKWDGYPGECIHDPADLDLVEPAPDAPASDRLTVKVEMDPEISKLLEEAHAALKAANDKVDSTEAVLAEALRQSIQNASGFQDALEMPGSSWHEMISAARMMRDDLKRAEAGFAEQKEVIEYQARRLEQPAKGRADLIRECETLRAQLQETSEKLTVAWRERDAAKMDSNLAHQELTITREKLDAIEMSLEHEDLARRLGDAFTVGACMGLEIMKPKG